MRGVFLLSAFLFSLSAYAQSNYPDSLISLLTIADTDSARFSINSKLSAYYFDRDRRKGLEFNTAALEIARKNNMLLDVARKLDSKGWFLNKDDQYGEALKCYSEAFILSENPANELLSWSRPAEANPYNYRMEVLAGLHHDLGHVLRSTGNHLKAIYHFKECLRYLQIALPTSYNSANMNIGATFLDLNILDSAYHYTRKGLDENIMAYRSLMLKYMGDIYFRQGQHDSAFYYYHSALSLANDKNEIGQQITAEYGLAHWHLAEKDKDSSLFYASEFLNGINALQGNPLKDINISNAYRLMYQAYELHGQNDSILKYLKLALTSVDSVSQEKIANLSQYQNITFAEQLRLEELEKEKLLTQNRLRVYSLLIVLTFILLVALILYRNDRKKQKANAILKKTLADLKSTQAQLIQSEKMASLGELTAGIAHEIQNPLNFVNNFSEVNTELIDEMQQELKTGNTDEALAISESIKENEEKINHHGKRADAIVKGMLQHSRSGSGVKEPTDINALAEEYLRLAYHGLRAKDKSFNATMKTDFDDSIGMISVIPQEIGRVILNLITNAFYVVNEKKKLQPNGFEPTVSVTTKKADQHIMVTVKDNGNGIPKEVMDKIFQPFFTTKPTGEGTGLGLSLSYDIVKAHGGELKVETKEVEGSVFVIQIPV